MGIIFYLIIELRLNFDRRFSKSNFHQGYNLEGNRDQKGFPIMPRNYYSRFAIFF